MKDKKKELEALASEYFLRELSDEEMASLEQGLQDDPTFGNFFVEAARDEWLMNDYQQNPSQEIIHFPSHGRQRKKVQRIAASIAIFLSVGAMFIAQHLVLKNNQMAVASIEKPVMAQVVGISLQEGDAVSAVNGGVVRSLEKNSKLYDGDRVVIPDGGSLVYQYEGEQTSVKMGGGTLFAISDDSGAKRIHITSGYMKASVQRQPEGLPMRITTHDAEAVVLGTTFEILVDQYTQLAVDSGLVRFVSRLDNRSRDVGAGVSARTQEGSDEGKILYTRILLPVQDETIGLNQNELMHLDAKKDHHAYLKFDLVGIDGRIEEARLRLRVVRRVGDMGGAGKLRLFQMPSNAVPSTVLRKKRVEISSYQGRVDAGADLEFVINPADLRDGMNTLLISHELNGDDFWVGSTESGEAPKLIVTVREES